MRLTVCCLAGLLLVGCSSLQGVTSHKSKTAKDKPDPPETVIVTYHVKSGNEAALEKLLDRAWKIYEKEGMVAASPHVIFRDKESGDATKYVELFTWINHAKPEHAPADVKAVWDELRSDCESRNGHDALEGGEIHLVVPAP